MARANDPVSVKGKNPGEPGYDSNQVIVKGGYYPPKGDYDAMHSFQKRGDGFGGRLNTAINAELRAFYKRGFNPTVLSLNLKLDDRSSVWNVKWEAVIGESPDGIAYISIDSRGSAKSRSTSQDNTNLQTSDKKAELKRAYPGTIFKDLLRFKFQTASSLLITQNFFLYTIPRSYPNLAKKNPTPSTGVVIDGNTGTPIPGATVQSPPSPTTETLPPPVETPTTPPPPPSPPAVGQISPNIEHLGNHIYLVKGIGFSEDQTAAQNKAGRDAEIQLYEYLNLPPFESDIIVTPTSEGQFSETDGTYLYTALYNVSYDPPVVESEVIPVATATTSSVANTSNKDGTFNVQVPPSLQANPNPTNTLNPYRFETKFISIANKYQASIYYNNDLILIKEFAGDFVLNDAGISYTDTKQAISVALQIEAQNIGFQSNLTQKSYPSLNELNSISNTNLPQEGVEISQTTETLPPEPIPVLPLNPTPITITAQGYEPLEIIPYKGDGTPKDNLGVVQLNPTKQSLESDKISSAQYTELQIDVMNTSKKDFKYYSQKKLNDSINDIKNKLIPVIITLIAEYGVTGAFKLIEKKQDNLEALKNKYACPEQAKISEIIDKKNKLVKQLNNLLKVIDSTIKALGISGGIIEALDIAYQVLKNLPVPSAVGGVGVPISTINNVQDAKDKIDKTIIGLKAVNAGLLVILVILQQVLSQALKYLNLLDSLTQACSPNTPEQQETISAELIALTNQQSVQQSQLVTNVNGFEMGVETEITTNPLKRRRAIARNKQGVVMLKGEWSYSSIDQILVDELTFYIQINNLRAD